MQISYILDDHQCTTRTKGKIYRKEAYLDKTDKTGRFVAVTVKFIKKLDKSVKLEEIKKNKELSHLSLIRQSRLSVMPIDSKSWKILNNMGKV